MVIGIAFRAFKEAITSEEERLEKASKLRNSGHFLEADDLLDQQKRVSDIIQGPIIKRIGNWIDHRAGNVDATECDARIKYMLNKYSEYIKIHQNHTLFSPKGTELRVSILNQLIKVYILFGPHKTPDNSTPLIFTMLSFRETMLFIEYRLAELNSQLRLISFLAESRAQSLSKNIEGFNENRHRIDEILSDCEDVRESMKLRLIDGNSIDVKERSELQLVLKILEKEAFPLPVLTYFKSTGSYIAELLFVKNVTLIDSPSRLIGALRGAPEEEHEEYDRMIKIGLRKTLRDTWEEEREKNPNLCEDYEEISEILRTKLGIDLSEIVT